MSAPAVPAGTAASVPSEPFVPAVEISGGGLRHEMRAARVVWQRDMLRFWTDRGRLVSSLLQPLLFLFVLGKGLGASLGRGGIGGVSYSTFLFPGTLTTGIIFTAVFSAISIVWDREFGFLREMLVAPISRTSIVIGKCLGGATVATLQGVVLLAIAGLVNVPYHPLLLLGCLLLMFLTALAVTAAGLVISVRVSAIQTVMPRVQLLIMPLTFLSGSLFPVGGSLPAWLRVVTRLNPLSYGVDAMRVVVFHYVHHDRAAANRIRLTWNGWIVPLWLDIVVIAGLGGLLLAVACAMFSRTE